MADSTGNKVTVRGASYRTAADGNKVLPSGRRDLADALNNTTTYTYDPTFSRVLNVTDAEGKTSTNTYSTAGNLITSSDPAGNVTTYVYNANGQPTEIQKPGGAVQALVYDTASGNIAGMGDSYGNLTQIGYDNKERTVPGMAGEDGRQE